MATPNIMRPINKTYLLKPIEQTSAPRTKIKLECIISFRRPYKSDIFPAKRALNPATPKESAKIDLKKLVF